ncbi:helix-turn-helix transcriptional regulator [Streptomyces sp. NPDC049555]|uniref:helix-turn-helix domain-containing protein n=1 Tax=Streptomyces sp. NPDC049555 TaxID=3154930 RepID=UPI0034480BF7
MAGQTQELARALSELKDRAGLSYGALAKRLHTSTSTLHRYCHGAAVPGEYAAVERFARACGAEREQLVELHRLWILADAEREAARKAPTPAPPADPEPVPPVAASGSGQRRVRLALIAAMAVGVATVGTAFAGSYFSADRGTAATPRDTAGSASDGGSANPWNVEPNRGALPSADASRSPGLPFPQWNPTGPPALPTTPPPATAPGPPPPAADVRAYSLEDRCGSMYVSGRTPGEAPAPPEGTDARGWVTGMRAVAGGRMQIQVTVQGKGREAVVLHGLSVHVVDHSDPLEWTGYSMGEGCGSGLTPRTFDIDLDTDRPVAQPKAGVQNDVELPAAHFPLRVSSADPEVLDVVAHTDKRAVAWYLDLEWSSGARRGTLRIDDNGRPFRTSAVKSRPQYTYNMAKKVWEPLEDYARH